MRLTMYVAVAVLSLLSASNAKASLIITGVIDGPLTGGTPKAVELFALADIQDLSIYGIESANNGAASVGPEFLLSGSATAGQFIYVASESPQFQAFFGFVPTFVNGVANINGDDAIVLFENSTAIDAFGVVGVDGTGEPWDHLDGWAYRNDFTGPSVNFVLSDWTFSGVDALDGATSNATAANPMPIGTFTPVPEPSSLALLGLFGLGWGGYRRRRAA